MVCDNVSSSPVSETMISVSLSSNISGVAWYSGLFSSIGCITVQVSLMTGTRLRVSAKSWNRRISCPSLVTSVRKTTRWTRASTIRLLRSLASLNIRCGTPLYGQITATLLNKTRAVGRENFEKTRPVTTAKKPNPVIASAVTSILAASPCGDICP